MALTPIFVVLNRSNFFESILILVLLVSVWAFNKALQNGKLRWLILCAAIVGIGFNVKMLEAFIVLPSIYIIYLLFTPVIKFRKRIIHLLIATIVLAAVSFSWITLVELTPKAERPYIGSTTKNSAFELAFEYNGSSRFNNSFFKAINVRENGEPGILRLFNKNWAGQISWFLFTSIAGMIVFFLMRKDKTISFEKRRFYLFWMLWLLTCYPLFSYISGMAHHYYIVMLTPSIAVLSSIAISLLWQTYRKRSWQGWLLPAMLFLNSLLQIFFITRYKNSLIYEKYGDWLIALILIASIIGTASMLVFRYKEIKKQLLYSFLVILISSNLIAPFVWSLTPIFYKNDAYLPMVGPELIDIRETISNIWQYDWYSIPYHDMDDLSKYLIEHNKENEKYILAAISETPASQIMLLSDRPVIILGGFIGNDNIFSSDDIQKFLEKREVRYLLTTRWNPGPQLYQNLIPVISKAKQVLPDDWDPNRKLRNWFDLYDCFPQKP